MGYFYESVICFHNSFLLSAKVAKNQKTTNFVLRVTLFMYLCAVKICIMSKLNIWLLCLILFFFLSGSCVYAQRTARNQYFAAATLSPDFSGVSAFGGSFTLGQYLMNSYWLTGISIDNRNSKLSSGHKMDCTDFYVEGGWMYRFFATRSRKFCGYIGGTAFIGYQAYNTFDKLPSNITTSLGKGIFLYGLKPTIEIEYFIFPKTALLAKVSMPIQFDSPTGWIKGSVGIGARYNF